MPLPGFDVFATNPSLLSRVRHLSDHASWAEFYRQYRGLIGSAAMKAGLTPDEADDVLQETFIALTETMPEFRYEPARCRFRSWLRHLTEHKIADQLRKRGRRQRREVDHETAAQGKGRPVEEVPDPKSVDLESVWDAAFDQHLLARARDAVRRSIRPHHFQIYDFRVLREMPVAQVARLLDVNPAQIYLVQHRVAKKIARELAKLRKEYGE